MLRALGGLGAAPILAACNTRLLDAPERGPFVALFTGSVDDGDICESAYRGLARVRDELKIPVRHVDRIAAEQDGMLEALRAAARSGAMMVIAVGEQLALPAQRVAWELPQQRFTVIQSGKLRPNLAVYEVLAEQPLWLAGAAAGLLTKTNVVGHLAARDDPAALRGRAAFADGLRATNAAARLLTTLMSSDVDGGAHRRVALAQTEARADIVLAANAAWRTTVIDVCRTRGVRAIGTVADWVARGDPVFVAAAVVDTGSAVLAMARDLQDSVWRGDYARRFGVRQGDFARLTLATGVPERVAATLEDYRAQLAAGRLRIAERYDGPEFDPARS